MYLFFFWPFLFIINFSSILNFFKEALKASNLKRRFVFKKWQILFQLCFFCSECINMQEKKIEKSWFLNSFRKFGSQPFFDQIISWERIIQQKWERKCFFYKVFFPTKNKIKKSRKEFNKNHRPKLLLFTFAGHFFRVSH